MLMATSTPQQSNRFFMNSDYVQGYIALSVSSDEERILSNAIRSLIKTYAPSATTLLDIGCADGRLTNSLSSSFEKVSFFEPNPQLFNMSRTRLQGTGRVKHAINAPFPPPNRYDEMHDVVLCSHVLYHVDLDEWGVFFESISRTVSGGGILIIVLWNTTSLACKYSMLANPYRWLTTDSDIFLRRQSWRNCGFKLISSVRQEATIQAETPEVANTISKFLLGERDRRETVHAHLQLEMNNVMHRGGMDNSQTIFVFQQETK